MRTVGRTSHHLLLANRGVNNDKDCRVRLLGHFLLISDKALYFPVTYTVVSEFSNAPPDNSEMKKQVYKETYR